MSRSSSETSASPSAVSRCSGPNCSAEPFGVPPMKTFEGKLRLECRVICSPHASRLTPSGSNGFTLLEVMAAVAILAFVLVSLLGLKNRSMQDVIVAEKITTATLLAQRQMTQTLLKSFAPMEDEGGFEEEEFEEYFWKRTVSPTPIAGLMEVRIAVLWKEGTRQESVELVSYE